MRTSHKSERSREKLWLDSASYLAPFPTLSITSSTTGNIPSSKPSLHPAHVRLKTISNPSRKGILASTEDPNRKLRKKAVLMTQWATNLEEWQPGEYMDWMRSCLRPCLWIYRQLSRFCYNQTLSASIASPGIKHWTKRTQIENISPKFSIRPMHIRESANRLWREESAGCASVVEVSHRLVIVTRPGESQAITRNHKKSVRKH